MSTKSDPIVVGIDGTPASDQALAWALDEAVVRGCPLHVVNAWNFEAMTDWTETAEQRAQTESEVLERVSEGASMLVVASHTGHRMRQIVLGSTSMHCVRHAHAPIVVIPVDDREYAEPVR